MNICLHNVNKIFAKIKQHIAYTFWFILFRAYRPTYIKQAHDESRNRLKIRFLFVSISCQKSKYSIHAGFRFHLLINFCSYKDCNIVVFNVEKKV